MDIELLIAAVFKRNALWDKRLKSHSNRNVTQKLWKEISDEMGTEDLGSDIVFHIGSSSANFSTMPRKCCVPQCHNTHKEAICHRFPYYDEEVYNIWVSRISNPKLLDMDPKAVYKLYVVCDAHFNEYCHIGPQYSSVSGLKKRCLPTLNLPYFNEPCTLENSILPYQTSATIVTGEETADMSENPVTDITIREALREDMHQVCRLIKDLAEFEKLQSQVKINSEILMKDGFDTDSPAFKCFVAELCDGPIIGYALYYTCYSTWLGKSIFLEDLYVDPAYRKCGVGKELILSVAKVAHETSKRLDFHVLSWNPAVEFYKSLGATNLTSKEQWQLFRLDENSLNKLFNN